MLRRFARMVLVILSVSALGLGEASAQFGFGGGGFGGFGGGFGGFGRGGGGGGGGFGRGGGFGGFGGGGMRGGRDGGPRGGREGGGYGRGGRDGGYGRDGGGRRPDGIGGRGYPGREVIGRGRYPSEERTYPGRPHPGRPYPPRPRPEPPYPVVKHPYPRPPVVVHYPPRLPSPPVAVHYPPRVPPVVAPPRRIAGPPPVAPPPPAAPPPAAPPPPPVRRAANPPSAGGPFVPNEVLVTMRAQASPAQVQALERRLGLVPVSISRIALLDSDLRRYRVPQNPGVQGTVQALRGDPAIRSAQPNFIFETQGDVRFATPPPANPPAANPPAAEPSPAEPPKNQTQPVSLTPPGSNPTPNAAIAPPGSEPERPTQYAIEALRLADAHRVSTGADVRIAIIDTGMDETHPEIAGKVVDRFDAIGGTFTPHTHGTAMAGVIVADKGLLGVAPKARLIAIRAFSGRAQGAQGTSNDIVRSIDYAVTHQAQILNMSFAGPRDELLAEVLAVAREKGVIEVAAAGNAGPDSPPLYPAAEPGVIAITATDNHNALFAKANRGTYVAAAAPGVDILVPSPGGTMQLTSGTSVAAAEASGVIALLLQTYPRMGATVAKRVLSNTAMRLPSGGDGTVLINASAAVQTVPR